MSARVLPQFQLSKGSELRQFPRMAILHSLFHLACASASLEFRRESVSLVPVETLHNTLALFWLARTFPRPGSSTDRCSLSRNDYSARNRRARTLERR